MSRFQNSHLTFKANKGVGRHGWLRLTPAYSVALVRDKVAHLPSRSVVTDPFSGTGTTLLAAAEHGHLGQAVDVNPFLVWLGGVKTRHFMENELEKVEVLLVDLISAARRVVNSADLWQPSLFKIERWWSQDALHALKALRHAIDLTVCSEGAAHLYSLALCRSLIATSNAAFNHQSMSFKSAIDEPALFDREKVETVLGLFAREVKDLVESAQFDLEGSARIILADSRSLPEDLEPCDLLLTSPPYVNRMSYIRELRPYMYWLRYLDVASDAAELDWKAIGGTWGIATSRLVQWTPGQAGTPVDEQMTEIRERIVADGGKNGQLLSNYVGKYFHDMWAHFRAARDHVRSGGSVSYIIGNSTFYGHIVPAEQWYAKMLRELGFEDVTVRTIRKRNSNKHLYEYDVTARRP